MDHTVYHTLLLQGHKGTWKHTLLPTLQNQKIPKHLCSILHQCLQSTVIGICVTFLINNIYSMYLSTLDCMLHLTTNSLSGPINASYLIYIYTLLSSLPFCLFMTISCKDSRNYLDHDNILFIHFFTSHIEGS